MRQVRDHDREGCGHERQGRDLMRQGFAETAAKWENGGPDEMYGYPTVTHSYSTVTRRGPRRLHFRGRRPIPRLPELASNCVRPAAALRDDHCSYKNISVRKKTYGQM